MSVQRVDKINRYFDIFEVDTFVLLAPVSISGVTNGGTTLSVAISDSNSGADLYLYTYHIQRSVDGGPFVNIADYVAGGVSPSYTDNVDYVVSTTGSLPDGTVVTFPSTTTYVTTPTYAGSPTVAALLFDTTLIRAGGHSQIVSAGTLILFAPGAINLFIATPKGHIYSYKISAQNKYAATPVSAASSVTVNSAFSAQTQAALTRSPDNSLNLSWTDPNSYSSGQWIEVWKDVNGAGYSLLTKIVKGSGAMPTAFSDVFNFFTMVPAIYSYKISPVSAVPQDIGPFSNIQSFTVSFSLVAPTALAASSVTNGISLTWSDANLVASEAGLYVYRDTGNTGVFTRIASVAPGALAYADVFAKVPGQVYVYKVSAFNHLHEGPSSLTVSISAALATPTITQVVQAADVGAIVKFSDTNTLETAYTLQRSVNGGAFASVTASIPAGVTSYQDSFSYPITTKVAYQIMATNATTVSALSPQFLITLSPQLVAPTNVLAVIAQTADVRVTWTNISPLIRGTNILKSTNGSALALVATTAASVTQFDDVFQTISGEVYAYSIQNFDNQETGPASPAVAVTTSFDPPQNLHVTGTSANTANISWATKNVLMDYTSIETAFANSGQFAEVARIQPGQTLATITITGGTPGEPVSFRIREIKQSYTAFGTILVPQNLGQYSLTVSTTTALLAPASVVVTRPNPNQNIVTWIDSNVNATGFQVWRALASVSPVYGQPVLVGAVADPTLRTFTDNFPMAAGLTVQYWLYAFNASNSSPQSNIATLSTRLNAGTVTTLQTARTQITLTMAPPSGYSVVAGDQVQISRSINGSTMNVISTIAAFAVPTSYVDNAFTAPANINNTISYSIRFFSSVEAGLNSFTVNQVLYDAVFMPGTRINDLKIWGSRNAYVVGGQGVFAGCDTNITRVTNTPSTFEPILLTSSVNGGLAAISSGDLTRVVADDGASMYLLDANTLTAVAGSLLNHGFALPNQAGNFVSSGTVRTANFSGNSDGNYRGWALATQTGTGVNGVSPWDSTSGNFNNYDGSVALNPEIVEAFIATPFGGSFTPARLENIGGDAVGMVLQTTNVYWTTGYNAALFRVQRSTNQAIEVFNIANYVTDIVSDSVSKVLAVTSTGAIYLIDMGLVPASAGSGFLGYNTSPIGAVIGQIPMPTVYQPPNPFNIFPTGRPGDIILIGTGMISVEIGAGQRVATATYNGGNTTVHIWKASGGLLTLAGTLALVSTFVVNERIGGLAFDGGKFFYGRSIDTVKLFRFDAGI